ncbi:phosphotransferase [Cyanobacteria bacterium FACHB-63]|nr:phosphotransferase [Cyanobacteria bacterium FACHB-63]
MASITTALVAHFLQSQFDGSVSDVSLIGSGMFSQAFSFTLDRQSFIIRLNACQEDFQKDAFAYQQFTSSKLPISRVIQSGRFNELYYFAITERCIGVTLNDMEPQEIEQVLPKLFDTLLAIHTLDSSDYPGWGLTDASGQGRFASWQSYLLSFYNQKFPFTWKQLIQDTFMEQEIYDKALAIILKDLEFCSSGKYWVHGDFGFGNVISDRQQITGVLDWAELLLGDYVYDIAYLEFWSEDICYKQQWQHWAKDKEIDLSLCYFEERLRCYMLHIGLKGLAIAAIRNDPEDYVQVRARIQKILDVDRSTLF